MKILLVDDHTILSDGVKSLLSQESDLEIVGQAGSAEAALEFLKKQDVDLIITDYSMPGMDGLSLLNTVKRIAPDTKIILLSMHDEVHLVKEILKAGVNGYVLKND
ncbi:MAG TPA: response regulator transcription factor, partial [Cyclobacteriaceae bacterium]|nr:response regulator transcription factor [Cyclobacteriaceae bacterium]